MRQTTVNVELSVGSIKAAIKRLEQYKKRLEQNTELLVSRLASRGLDVLNAYVADIPEEFTEGAVSAEVIPTSQEDGRYKAVIHLTGRQAVFVEFGTGVYFNGPVGSVPHPKGGEFGFSIGSYSFGPGGTKHAAQPYGWWKPGGEHTYGSPANAPLWNTAQDLELMLVEVAQEVFM